MALYGFESFDGLFRRCLSCGTETPSCPTCDTGYLCSVSPVTCTSCPSTSCVIDDDATETTTPAITSTSHSSPNVGAIAGGVIGGVAVIAIITYLVWRFCIKTRRQQYEQENWAEELEEEVPENNQEKPSFAMQRDARASTYTVGSIASTVLTRASNIIQIAYIPGVTNRSTISSPGLLVPPVPPIPVALSSAATTPLYDDQHFFMPGDLRDSTYSGISDRTSYARTSVASTIYGKNAIVSPLPAQTGTIVRGKAAVVSVGSKTSNNTTGEITPPVPSLDYSKYRAEPPPSPAFSVGSTFLSNASAATAMRPTMVSVSSGSKGSALSKEQNESNASDAASFSSADVTPYRDIFPTPPTANNNSQRNRDTTESNATLTTFIDDSSNPNTPRRSRVTSNPFNDPEPMPTTARNGGASGTLNLSRVIEEATRRATARPVSGLGARTPFGDENATDDN